MSKYFKPDEFRRCTPACEIEDMQPAFLALLDEIREAAGIAMTLNSAYRSVEYEIRKGRPGTSSHCKGVAVDVRCPSNQARYKIIAAALGCGITRIGVGKSYVHLDADDTKSQGVIWHYYE